MKDALDPRLVAMALRIARGFVRRVPRSIQVDDLTQAALLGLWDALQKDPNASDWYCSARIRGSVIDELRRQDWLPRRGRASPNPVRVLHLEDIRTGDGSGDGLTIQLPAGGASPEDLAAEREEVERAWRTPLPERDRRMMVACYGNAREMVHSDLAQREGLSEPRICQIITRSLATMRHHMTGEEPAACVLAEYRLPGARPR
jgi:RNA polymerase sigma factor for flagellar operon FliA